MRITKRQLRRIIKEEKRKFLKENSLYEGRTGPWPDLVMKLGDAEGIASMIDPADPQAIGTEANDLADMLQSIWEAAGFDPSEIFK